MDNVTQQGLDDDADAMCESLEDLAIHDLRVDILRNAVHLRGLVSGYEKKCLAGARARTAFPWTHVSNELRVGHV